MSKPLVIIDAGHAEYVEGKQSPDKSLREWDFNNQMQYKLKARLESLGFEVYLTNPSPAKKDEIGLEKRASLANAKWKALGKPNAIFISIHANAFGVWTTANGAETYYAKNASQKSKDCAKIIQKQIHTTLKSLRSDSVNRGVKVANFTVIYKANMPSILIEYAFYTNKKDLAILKNNKDELGEATVKGLCEYFGVTYKAPNSKPTSEDKKEETKQTATSNLTGKYIVRYLQKVLNSCYNCKLDVDGYYGTKTKSAVKSHYLQKGDKGEHVKWLQQALVNRGYKIEVDGSFGNATLNALKKYQKSRGLVADGYAGLNTHTKIVND